MGLLWSICVVSVITSAGGVLIFLMVCLTIVNDVTGESMGSSLYLVAGCLGWLAIALLLRNVSVVQRWQTGVIAVAGLALMLTAFLRGVEMDFSAAISNNAGLVSMIASVGFLRLVTLSPADDSRQLPVGPAAFYKTMLGVSLLGAVINLSAPVIFADRLMTSAGLPRITSQSLTRVFSGCSAWSPFFGGMAVVLTYVPAMQLSFVMLCCLPFAIVGFFFVCAEARLRYSDELKVFRGYPVKYTSLWIPAALAIEVVLVSHLSPRWSVLTCISLSALSLTIVVLLLRKGVVAGVRAFGAQVTDHLPKMISELMLFFVAGVLATGLAAVIKSGLITVPFIEFHMIEAVGLLGAMVLMAMIGVHPVVTVAGATPLILTLEPNANLLAVTFLFAWSLGTCGSPLSGTHLVFQGRYGVPSWKGASWNWSYVFWMFLVAVPILYLIDKFD